MFTKKINVELKVSVKITQNSSSYMKRLKRIKTGHFFLFKELVFKKINIYKEKITIIILTTYKNHNQN